MGKALTHRTAAAQAPQKKKGEILKFSGQRIITHKAAVVRNKEMKTVEGKEELKSYVGVRRGTSSGSWKFLLMLMRGLLLEHCVKT